MLLSTNIYRVLESASVFPLQQVYFKEELKIILNLRLQSFWNPIYLNSVLSIKVKSGPLLCPFLALFLSNQCLQHARNSTKACQCVDSKVGDSNHIPGLKMHGNLAWILPPKSMVKVNFEMSVLRCPIGRSHCRRT